MNLFEINANLQLALETAVDPETGELIDEEAMNALNELQMTKDEKVLNIAKWIKNLDADAKALKEQKQIFAERQAAVERKIDSLKKYLAAAVPGEKFEDAQVKISWRKSSQVKIQDEEGFLEWAQCNADDLLKYAEPTISKTEVKKAIESGREVRFAEIVENQSVQIK